MADMILGVTGLARAGKDTLAGYIASQYGFKIFTMSDSLKSECMRRGLDITKENLSRIGDMMRDEFGNDIVAIKTLEKASSFPRSIITGVRSPEELDVFKRGSGAFSLVCIVADENKRFDRRSDKDPNCKEDFLARDRRDIANKGLGKVMDMADFIISNDSTYDSLYRSADRLVENLGAEHSD